MSQNKTPASAQAYDFPRELLEKLIPGPAGAAENDDVFQRLKKAMIEQVLGAELGMHLADPKAEEATTATGGVARR
jgi:putative transposase